MEKKFFLLIPLFFLLFSLLFPFKGGKDWHFVPAENSPNSQAHTSKIVSPAPKLAGMLCTCHIEKEGFSASGFLDGTLIVDGRPLENSAPGKYKTVYAVAVSDDLSYLSVVSGLYPRTLYVYENKHDSWDIIHSAVLSHDVRRIPFLAFSGDMLLYEDENGISVFNLTTFSRFSMAFSGTLKDVEFDPEQEYVWVVSGNDEGEDRIQMFLYNGSLVASARYDGTNIKTLKVVEQ